MIDRDPQLGKLFPEYAIKHVLICTTLHPCYYILASQYKTDHVYIIDLFPNVFLGWGKNGKAGDGLRNENYNWTGVCPIFDLLDLWLY